MRKKIAAFILALVLSLSLVPAAFAADMAKASTQSVEVDGAKIEFQMYALVDANGGLTNYVKLRDVAHVLNSTPAKFSVGYDGVISIVTGESYTDNGSEMTTPFSGDRAYKPGPGAVKVNGADVNLDAIVLTDDNGGAYTYFKLRDLGTALGFKVDWTSERGVFIETGTGTAPTTPAAPADDGQLTLEKLQGTWSYEGIPGWGVEEYTFTGNQMKWVTSADTGPYPYSYYTADVALDDVEENHGYLRLTNIHQYQVLADGSEAPTDPPKDTMFIFNFSANGFAQGAKSFVRTDQPTLDKKMTSFKETAAAEKAANGSVYGFLASYVQQNVRGSNDSTTTRHSVSIRNDTLTNKNWRFILDYDNATGELFLRADFSKLSTSGKTNFLNSSTYELTLSANGGPYQGTYSGYSSASRPNTLIANESSATFTINPAAFTMQTERLSMRGDFDDAADTNGAVIMQGILRALNKEILQPNGYSLADLGFTNFP